MFQWVMIVTGLVLCGVLIRIIHRQWQQIKHPPQAQTVQIETGQSSPPRSEHLLNARESVQVIAQCMLSEQVELSEGCLRIKVLMDHIRPDWAQDKRLEIFEQVYEQLKDFPTHGARKAQSKQETFRQDRQRWKIEDDNREALLAAARVLVTELK